MGWGLGDDDAEGLELGDEEGDWEADGLKVDWGLGDADAEGLELGDAECDSEADGLEVG